MIFAFFLMMCHYNTQTTTNTCQNDPTVYKIDIRQRIRQLCDTCTVEDLDLDEICHESQQYDYIWFTQLWIPSMYNHANLTNPQQTNDYREFQSIKEYSFDPNLGTLDQFTSFVQQLKSICYHIKVLGEFSLYIGQDSSLLQNKTRFLLRPLSISFNEQNNRYDDNQLVWAVNSKGLTIPYTAVWNYFQLAPISDIQDIIYNQIITVHQLDGVLFLQPSLGLYEIVNKYYTKEIQYYGDSTMLYDFYQNFGIKYNSSNYYFMGDQDNINNQQRLLASGLAQIYGLRLRSNSWLRINYTFSQQLHSSQIKVDNLTSTKILQQTGYPINGAVDQPMYNNSLQCITYNFTSVYYNYYSGTMAGIVNLDILSKYDFVQPYAGAKNGLDAIQAGSLFSDFFGKIPNGVDAFDIKLYDKIQVQVDTGYISTIIFIKLEVKHIFNPSSFIKIKKKNLNNSWRFGISLYGPLQTLINIAFPYRFTNNLKSPSIKINGDRHIECIKDSDSLQFAQVFQTINQFEPSTTLNILALNMPASSNIALGVCNRDLISRYNHLLNQTLQSGTYLYQSNGYLIHSNIPQYNNQMTNQEYQQGDLISITFIKSNYSIVFQRNSIFISSFQIGQYVRNLNFCVGLYKQYQSVSLEY